MGKKIFTFIGRFFIIILFIYTNCLVAEADAVINIPLVYPQNSNAPKREPIKNEQHALKNEVLVDVTGINPAQLKNPNMYIEYFLDYELIYSTQNKKQGNLGFRLDTTKYTDGPHTLTVNLWDRDGSSAIGITNIIIQNGM